MSSTDLRVTLCSRTPRKTGAELLAELSPPPQFAHASFASYVPDENYASQRLARDTLAAFVSPVAHVGRRKDAQLSRPGFFRSFFGGKKASVVPVEAGGQDVLKSGDAGSGDAAAAAEAQSLRDATLSKSGVYLDGGFGVGKTHLLAAAWHAAAGRKHFGTFIEYTALVGALGYNRSVELLRGTKLICIDEFELDDPGDTMLMTRLLGELCESGTRVLATSNTPPGALGEGRFAAADFMREIMAMSDRFQTLRIDGVDYRQRDLRSDAIVLTAAQYESRLLEFAGQGPGQGAMLLQGLVSDDDFGTLIDHLARVHPSSYSGLLQGVVGIGLRDVYELTDQSQALRVVAFIDRVYDAQIPLFATGVALTSIFGGGMLEGGYRKKYMRCMSRMNALTAMSG